MNHSRKVLENQSAVLSSRRRARTNTKRAATLILVMTLLSAMSPSVRAAHSVNAFTVITPYDYGATDARYPVVYFWFPKADCPTGQCPDTAPFIELFRQQPFITVVGSAPAATDYIDWRDGSATHGSDFVAETVPWVDSHYRTIPQRHARAVGGISAGGYGAMLLAAHRPDLFGHAAAFSAPLDLTSNPISMTRAPEGAYGPFLTEEVWWHDANPTSLAMNLSSVDVWVATGDGTACPGEGPSQAAAPELLVKTQSDRFHAALDRYAIDHRYSVGCGQHTGFATGRWLEETGEWLSHLSFEERAVSSFDHARVLTDFSVWDWRFEREDAVADEFLYISDASEDGLTLSGSGSVLVSTAPIFPGGAPIAVTIDDRTEVIKAREGRLQFVVDLGSPHRDDQFSLAQRARELPGDYFTELNIRFSGPGKARP